MNKKYCELIDEIQKTLDDKEVKSNEELTKLLREYKEDLENGEEYKLTCTKLTNDITSYIRYNKFKAPEAVLSLYNHLANVAAKYRGLSSFITWF